MTMESELYRNMGLGFDEDERRRRVKPRPVTLAQTIDEEILDPIDYTDTEARGFGLKLYPGWKLEVKPSPAGVAPDFSFLDDQGQEWIKKGGVAFSLDDIKKMAQLQPQKPPMTETDIEEMRLSSTADAIYEYQKNKSLTPPTETDIEEIRLSSTADLVSKRTSIEGLVPQIFPAMDADIFFRRLAVQPEQALEDLKAGGNTPEKQRLLRLLGASDEEINQILPLPKTFEEIDEDIKNKQIKSLVDRGFDPKVAEGQIKLMAKPKYDYVPGMSQFTDWLTGVTKHGIESKVGGSFMAGVGDVITTAGGTSRWLGDKELGDMLSSVGGEFQAFAPPDTLGEFNLEDLGNPDFYLTKGVRVTPFALSLVPMALAGFYGGGAVAAALGIGKIATMIISGFAGAAMSRPVESALEAGSAYDDVIAKGGSEKEAKEAADKVFKRNLTLTGMDAAEIAIAMAPTPAWVPKALVTRGLARTVTVGGKMVIVGLSEGGEEAVQEYYQRKAKGEEIRLDPVMAEAIALGAVMGIGMGLGGDVISTVTNKTKAVLSKEEGWKFAEKVIEYTEQGFGQQIAEVKAIDDVMTDNPSLQQKVSDIIAKLSGAVPQTAQAIAGVEAELKPGEQGVPGEAPQTPSAKEPWQMTREERQAEIARLKTENKEILATPLMSEGSISPFQVGSMGKQQRARWEKNSMLRMDIESRIKTLESDERIASLKVKAEAKEADELARTVWIHTKEEWVKSRLAEKPQSLSHLTDKEFAKFEERRHAKAVKWAVEHNKAVPAEVLKDYPELAKQAKPATNAEIMARPPRTDQIGSTMKPVVEEVSDIGGFEQTLSPSNRALAITQMNEKKMIAGKAQSRKEYIEDAVSKGATVGIKEGKPALVFPDGRYIRQSEITKTALDYANYLKDKSPIPAPVTETVSEGAIPPTEPPTPTATEQAPELEGETTTGLEGEVFATELTAEGKPPSPPPPPAGGVSLNPPEPSMGATKQVMDRISFDPDKTSIRDKFQKGWTGFMTKIVDDLYSVKKFTEQATKGGVRLSIEENPYLMARLLRGVTSKSTAFLENGTFGRKFWKVKNGKVVPDFKGEGLKQILSAVKEPAVWRDFSAYLIANHAVELNNLDIETGITLETANQSVQELEARYPEFAKLADKVHEYQKQLLDYAEESGLISKELRETLNAKYYAYVPFFRVMDELESGGYMGKKMANIAKPVKRIKGSERTIINPLESIVKNTYAFISAADRNQVGVMMARLANNNPELADMFTHIKTPISRVAQVTAKELGVEVAGLTEEQTEEVFNVFRPAMFNPENTVTVLIEGKKQFYKADPDLYKGILAMDNTTFGMIAKIASLPAKWLRAGATLSPDFMIRNPARDQMSAFVYSSYNFIPGVDFIRGIASLIKRDNIYNLYKMSGAEHSMLVSLDREYIGKTFKEIVEGKGLVNHVKNPLELLQILSEFGEKATRLGEFKAGLTRGKTPIEAGYASREVTLDFAKAGTTSKAINQMVAFFNANIRGWDKMISSFKEHPARTSFKAIAGITIPSILLYLVNRDEDWWKEVPQWQKDLFWLVKIGDTIYRIPKPFELGIIFGSIPERFLEYIDSQDKRILSQVMLNAAEAGSPGFIPTGILPILENWTNYSFFKGYELVPESRQKMLPSLQYTKYTSETAKKIGELINYSPAKIDNIINGWTGGLGRYAVNTLDAILKKTGISPDIPEPSAELADYPVARAFVVRNPYGSQSASLERFYDITEEYGKNEQYLKEMLKNGDEKKFNVFLEKHPELLFSYDWDADKSYSASARYLRSVSKELSDLTKKADTVYKSTTISSDEKRRLITEIDKLKTEVARRALDNFPATSTPKVLDVQLKETEDKLGEIIGNVPPLSLEKPDVHDVKKLFNDYNAIFEKMTPEQINKMAGTNPVVKAYLDMKESEKTSSVTPDIKLSQYNLDPAKGDTYRQYVRQWKEMQSTSDPEEKARLIKAYDKAYLGNLTKRQIELLDKLSDMTPAERKQFIKDTDELGINPLIKWLRENPKDNASLALAGKEKVYSEEAYNLLEKMITDLDIPDKAIIPQSMPPKESVKNYFSYLENGDKFGYNSAEARILIAKDKKLQEFLEVEPEDTPIPALELHVKNRPLEDKYASFSLGDRETNPDWLPSIPKKDDPRYNKGREYAREKLLKDNHEWQQDRWRIEVMENDGDTWLQDKYIEVNELQAKTSDNSTEVKLWWVDHPEEWKWAQAHELVNKNKDADYAKNWNARAMRLEVKWRPQEAEYNALPTTGSAREDYLEGKWLSGDELKARLMYADDRRRIDLYKNKPDADINLENSVIEYYKTPGKGKRKERLLANDNILAQYLKTLNPDMKIPLPSEVPDVEYDNIYDHNKTLFDQYEEADGDGKKSMLKFMPKFARQFYTREAYGKFVSKPNVKKYAEWQTLNDFKIGDELPDGTIKNEYTEKWFMKENTDFYDEYRNSKNWKAATFTAMNFRKVPSREIYQKWQSLKNRPEYIIEEARYYDPDLEAWLVESGTRKPIDVNKISKKLIEKSQPGNWRQVSPTRASIITDAEKKRWGWRYVGGAWYEPKRKEESVIFEEIMSGGRR